MADLSKCEDDQSPEANAARLKFLRDRGVEVDLREERKPSGETAPGLSGPPFKYVYIPLDPAASVVEMSEPGWGGPEDGQPQDILPSLLAPRFADTKMMDSETVERETSARLKNMMLGGGDGKGLPAPSAATMSRLAVIVRP